MIPEADEIEIIPRKYTELPPDKYLPYAVDESLVPELVKAGEGYNFHITGLTHNEKGYPEMNAERQEILVHRLINKINLNVDKIVKYYEEDMEDADVVIVCYGITSRVVLKAVEMAKSEGIKIGYFRLIVIWPFPEKRIREIAKSKVKSIIVAELNYGQIYYEVERCSAGKVKTILVPHGGGSVHEPEVIYQAILESLK